MKSRYVAAVCAFGLLVAPRVPALARQAAAQDAKPVDARIWLGHAPELEEFLRTVPMQKFDDLSVGVTKPKKVTLPDGGPVKYLVWKAIAPGRYEGYWESYQNEVAAYDLDKILGLNMVPPTVERTYRGEHGAAIMWVSPSKSFKDLGVTGAPTPPAALQDVWNRQLVRAKMFHNLVNDVDPNLGNWLVDPAWDLILIDFSRCFTPGTKMPHALTRVDPALWDRMKELTEPVLTMALGKLLSKAEIKGILQRRDQMQVLITQLIKEHGEAYVYMRDGR